MALSTKVRSQTRWTRRRAGFKSGPVLRELGADYFEVMTELGAGEGFVGRNFLRLYAPDEVVDANEAYYVAEFLPGHVLFGSDGIGSAYLLDAQGRVVRAPFIPLDARDGKVVAPRISDFLETLGEGDPLEPDPATAGMELHEVHPVVLGGHPTDPSNRVWLDVKRHAEAATFFNRIVRKVRPPS